MSYNTRALLQGCLMSLRRVLDEVKLEIVVVDNASSDESVEMIERDFPEVRMIRSPTNSGFAKGVNAGLKAASGPFVLVLNPDCLVPRGSLRYLRDFLLDHDKAAVAGAGITTAKGRSLPSEFSIPTLFREFWNFLPEIKSFLLEHRWGAAIHRKVRPENPQPHPVEAVSGAAFMVRRDAFTEIDCMDEAFFVYHEELDLCRRLRDAGWEIWSVPAAQVIHFDAQATGYSTGKLAPFPILEWRVLGMDRLWQKHRTPREHQRWRKLARRLLQFRVFLIQVSQPFRDSARRTSSRERIRDLRQLSEKLTD